MITPQDFLSLADRLGAPQSEADLRTAISRAYYGAYHAARLLIAEECGVLLPKTADTHQNIYRCLMCCQDAAWRAAGSRLESLRIERDRADYDLASAVMSQRPNALVQIANAWDVIKQLSTARANMIQIRPAVRDYASRILKLGLRT